MYCHRMVTNIRAGADKSFARAGRKQATATCCWIYSTYCPRNSVHFSVRCSFASQSKKIRNLSVQPRVRGSNDLRFGRKMTIFQFFFFQSREQLTVRRGQSRRIGWVTFILLDSKLEDKILSTDRQQALPDIKLLLFSSPAFYFHSLVCSLIFISSPLPKELLPIFILLLHSTF